MNLLEIETRLREKEQELWTAMTRSAAEARSLTGSDPQDNEDLAASKEALFQETTSEWQMYAQVRDALERIRNGTYGTCADCGSAIEGHRLESVPWTAYCVRHQELREGAALP